MTQTVLETEDPTGPFDNADHPGTEPDATPEATYFSAREVPWMKLGKIQTDGPVDAATAAKLGGIDFEVAEAPISFMTKADGQPPKWHKIPDRKAIYRPDTGAWLSVVGKDYPVLQYGEAFDFMDGLSPEFVAAGALRKGRQGFMVVRSPGGLQGPTDDDPHELFGVLRTSHDCSRAVEVAVMPLRGRCMNQLTLNSFVKGIATRWTVTHVGDVKGKLLAAKETMARLAEYGHQYTVNATKLANITVTDENASDILKRVLPDRPKRDEVIVKIITGWHGKPKEVGFEKSGWGLVNAVSEYFEWDRTGGTPESRFLAALQGQTHSAINKTAALILTRN